MNQRKPPVHLPAQRFSAIVLYSLFLTTAPTLSHGAQRSSGDSASGSGCQHQALTARRELGDPFGSWSDTDSWYFGNRSNDPSSIGNDKAPGAAARNFGWNGPPYHEIDETERALQINFFEGEKALPHKQQIRFDFPPIGPENAGLATFAWEVKFDPRHFTGGKAFQLASGNRIHIELNPHHMGRAGGHYVLVPGTRAYEPRRVGGNGEPKQLSSRSWAQRNIQPALDAPGRRYKYCYSRDHVTGSKPRAFLVRPDQWYRFIYTLDWRSEPHRIFLWAESEDTERTLLLADEEDPNKGFVLQFPKGRTPIDHFYYEFNNSKSLNPRDFYVKVRNFFVLRDVMGDDV